MYEVKNIKITLGSWLWIQCLVPEGDLNKNLLVNRGTLNWFLWGVKVVSCVLSHLDVEIISLLRPQKNSQSWVWSLKICCFPLVCVGRAACLSLRRDLCVCVWDCLGWDNVWSFVCCGPPNGKVLALPSSSPPLLLLSITKTHTQAHTRWESGWFAGSAAVPLCFQF